MQNKNPQHHFDWSDMSFFYYLNGIYFCKNNPAC